MSVSQHLQPLLQKEMDRKEFLLTLALAIASIMGFSSIIRLFTGKSIDSHLTRQTGAIRGNTTYGMSGNAARRPQA